MRKPVKDPARLEHMLDAVGRIFPATPWKIIVGMSHFLVHGYYEVDAEEVWNVVEKDLQPLKEQLESYLKEFYS